MQCHRCTTELWGDLARCPVCGAPTELAGRLSRHPPPPPASPPGAPPSSSSQAWSQAPSTASNFLDAEALQALPESPDAAEHRSAASPPEYALESAPFQGTINAVDLFDPAVLADLTGPAGKRRSFQSKLEKPFPGASPPLIEEPQAAEQAYQASYLQAPSRSANGPIPVVPPRFTLPALLKAPSHLPRPRAFPPGDRAGGPGPLARPVEMGERPPRGRPRVSRNRDERGSSVGDRRSGRLPDPLNNPDALLKGDTHSQKQLPGAERLLEYQRTLASVPREVGALIGLAETLHRLGRLEEALQVWQRVIAVAPHRTDAYVEQGNVLAELRRYDEALARYQRALQRAPRHALAHRQSGRALFHLARYADALAAFERASCLAPTDGSALVGQGLALEALGQQEQALRGYTHALQIDPGNVPLMLHAGHLLLRLGRPRTAQTLARQVVAVQARNQGAWLIQGEVLMALGSYQGALAAYAHAIEIAPSDRSGYQGKARALACLGHHAEVDTVLKQANALAP